VSLGLIVGVAGTLFFAVGFDLIGYLGEPKDIHRLPWLGDPGFRAAYRVLSPAHLFDVLNQHLLVAPAALLAVSVVRRGARRTRRSLFLGVAAAFPLLFTFVANPEIGTFRDWDALSFAGLLLLGWAADALGRWVPDPRRLASAAVLVVGAAALHAAAWLALNADAERAETRFVRLLSSCPMSVHGRTYGWESIGSHYRRMQRPELALDAFEHAIESSPDNPRHWLTAGELHLVAGRDAEARRHFERALELNPKLADAWHGLGVARFRANEYDAAVRAFEKAVAQKRDHAGAWFNLGLCHLRQQRPEPAMIAFREVVKAQPDFAAAYFQLGVLHRARGELAPARAAFRGFLEREGTGPRADEVRRWLAEMRESG
jgi:tetratricopeptide (TPR) repeat protein